MLCGILGSPDHSLLAPMERALTHRVRSGWTRLEADNLSLSWGLEQERQALCGAQSRDGITLALVGSPYHEEVPDFATLFALVLARGSSALTELAGSYVGLYCADGQCSLFRDPAGRRTIYHTTIQGHTYFAVETRPLYRLPGFRPAIAPASLAQYLSFSYTPGPQTMLQGLYELPAGSRWNLRHAHPERTFTPETDPNSEPQPRTESQWIETFHDRFQHALTRVEMPGTRTKSLFLSGGLDSSLVAAALAERYGAAQVAAHAIHFGPNYPNELPYARQAAQHLGISCEEVEIRPRDFVPILPEMIQRLNDPIGDPVTMPNYLLAQHVAAQGVTAAYNGEGGDPLFGGPKNLGMLLHNWYGGPRPPRHQERAYLASYRRGYEERRHLIRPEWIDQIDEARDLEGVLTPYFTATQPSSYLKRLLLINMRLKGAHLILPKVERMLGAHGVTPLSPLYDEQLIRLSMQLPNALLLKHGEDKQILKLAATGRLPDHIIHRPKSGMRVPVHFWFKGEMRKYARHILLHKTTKNAGIFNQQRIKQLLRYDTDEGLGRYGIRIWMLLTFELWRREVFGES